MRMPSDREVREFQETTKHRRAPFGGCNVCGCGYLHEEACPAISKKRQQKSAPGKSK